MLIRLVVATTALVVTVIRAQPQSLAQKLDGGIYLQTHYGDDDRALHFYREVIADGGDRTLAGIAQMQIVSAMLHKGNFAAAAEEFKTLLNTYADQEQLVASLTKRLSGMRAEESAPTPPPNLKRGLLQTVYHLNSFGTEVTLPPGWSVTDDLGTDGVGDNIFFKDLKSNFIAAMYLLDPA